MVPRRFVFQCALLLVAFAAVAMGTTSSFYPGSASAINQPGIVVLKGVYPIDPLNPGQLLVPTNIYMTAGNITRMVPTATDTNCPFIVTKDQNNPCNKAVFNVIDYTDSRGPYFAVPGFVSSSSSMTLRSAVPANLNNPTTDLYQALASDFASLNPSDATAPAVATRVASYNTVLQAALQSGVTTWIDVLTNPADFAELRDTFSLQGQNILHLPNLYSMGPLIGLAGSVAGFADNTPWSYIIDPSQPIATIVANLNTQLVQWFNPTVYNFVGATVVLESYIGTSTVTMPPAIITAVVQAIVSHGKIAGFISNSADNMILAALAGARIHYGAPVEPKVESTSSLVPECNTNSVSYSHVKCQTAMTALSTLVTLGVVHTTEVSSNGGGDSVYLNSFPTYPNPTSVVYYTRSYYSLGMPSNIRSNYEAIWQLAASGNAAVNAYKQLRTTFLQNTYLPVLNYAAGQGVPFIVSSGSGLSFAFHSDSLLEGSLLSGGTAFPNNSALLYSMTYGPARAFGLWNVGRLWTNMTADVVIISGGNPLTTPVSQWNILDVYKFGFKQPDVGVQFTFGTAMALGAFGFAVLLVVLFVLYTVCCARLAEQAKRGDMAQSML